MMQNDVFHQMDWFELLLVVDSREWPCFLLHTMEIWGLGFCFFSVFDWDCSSNFWFGLGDLGGVVEGWGVGVVGK